MNILFFGGIARIDFPMFYNFKPMDAFTNHEDITKLVENFNYKKTYFFGIKASSLEILEYVRKMFRCVENMTPDLEIKCPRGTGMYPDGTYCENHESGFSIINKKTCEDCIGKYGTPYGFIDIFDWDKKWSCFMESAISAKRKD